MLSLRVTCRMQKTHTIWGQRVSEVCLSAVSYLGWPQAVLKIKGLWSQFLLQWLEIPWWVPVCWVVLCAGSTKLVLNLAVLDWRVTVVGRGYMLCWVMLCVGWLNRVCWGCGYIPSSFGIFPFCNLLSSAIFVHLCSAFVSAIRPDIVVTVREFCCVVGL